MRIQQPIPLTQWLLAESGLSKLSKTRLLNSRFPKKTVTGYQTYLKTLSAQIPAVAPTSQARFLHKSCTRHY